MRRWILSGCAVALAACTSAESYVVVTVTARPAVHDARTLTVTLANAGTERQDSFTLASPTFPVTFSVSGPGRTGELAIAIDATDERGVLVGRGTATTTLDADAAALALDATDFVVNTDYADNQFTSNDFEATGVQLAALPDGTWTAAFRDGCQAGSCNVYARRFDARGAALDSAVSLTSNAFNLSTKPTSNASTAALAASATTTLAVWDFFETGASTTTGVMCRALDPTGAATPSQREVAGDSADVVSLAALATGNFVASWSTSTGGDQGIHAVIIRPDCTPLGVVLAVSDPDPAFVHRASVASTGDRVLFTWLVDGDLHARVMSTAGILMGSDTVLVPKTATEQVVHARLAAVGDGFLLAVRWSLNAMSDGPGRIEAIKVDSSGIRVDDPILVTSRSASDADNREAFSIAVSNDRVMVAWHGCGALGDANQCGVFGRMLGATGAPLGDELGLATTTAGDQTRPSVVGLPDGFAAMWTDASQTAPDTSGQSVRARILYY